MTNFKLSLRTSAMLVLAIAFCCLVFGQVATAAYDGISNPYVQKGMRTPPTAPEKVSTRVFDQQWFQVDKNAIAPRPNEPRGDKQGGDFISNAVTFTTLPYSTTGTTFGYTHDYDNVCPYTDGTAPDVVYQYTPASDVTVNISLCGSAYDTKVYVYDTDSPVGTDAAIACNDDATQCNVKALQSYIEGLALVGGTTYYIVVDGYGTSNGAYNFLVEEYVECVVTCPAGASLEGGTCDVDNNNGTTSTDFGTIVCGETICGESWATGGYRDLDFYAFTLTETMEVTLTGEGHAPLQLILISDLGSGSGDVGIASDGCGDVVSCSYIYPAGDYIAAAASYVGEGYDCPDGSEYWFTMTCVPSTIIAGDMCDDPIILSEGVTLGTTVGASQDGSYGYGPDIWYSFTPTCNGTVTFSLCTGTPSTFDSYIFLYAGTGCPAGSYLVSNDDFCASYGPSQITAQPVTAGTPYTLQISSYGDVSDFTLTTTVTCGGAPPENDDCADAIPVTNGTYTGTNVGATIDGPFTSYGADVWYCYTATCDGQATASMCTGTPSTFDALLVVYNGCVCPQTTDNYIGNGDDDCGYTYGPSSYSWMVEAGEQYMIAVMGYSLADMSDFTLTMSCVEAGIPPVNDSCQNADLRTLTYDVTEYYEGNFQWADAECSELAPNAHVWIAFELTASCSNVTVSYCDGAEGVGWYIFTWMTNACPCLAPDEFWFPGTNSWTSCADGLPEAATITYDSLPAGTYYYPVLAHNNYGGGYDYVITVLAEECPPYCVAAGNCDEFIYSVALNEINNVSAECSEGGYADYTETISTALYKGVSYPITVTNGLDTYPTDQCGAWIDYDLDFYFEPEEYYYLGTGIGPYTGTITPPITAITGETTLRVRLRWNGVPEPCGTYWGEVEDYMIVLKDLPCGDVNFDGLYNEADVTYLMEFYFNSGAAPLPILANGDTNGDCCINIADIVFLADYVNGGGLVDLICLPCNP